MKQKIAQIELEIIQNLFIPRTADVYLIDLKNCFEIDRLRASNPGNEIESRAMIISNDFPMLEEHLNSETVVQFGRTNKQLLKYMHEFRFIQINGVMRWIYPKGQMKSIFDFYNASTARGKLMKLGLRALAFCRLDVIISKKMTVHSNDLNCLQVSAAGIPFEQFCVFMGTPGIERTALVALLTKGQSTHFLKIGLNPISKVNVGSERDILHKLNSQSLEYTVIPIVELTESSGVIALSKLAASSKKITNQFLSQHANSLLELASLSRTDQRFDESTFGEVIIDNCALIRKREGGTASVASLLLECLDDLPHDYHFSAGLAHGDFTPWNMFLTKDQLHLYDWEAAMRYAPSLFDLFHYHFQTGIYLKKWSFNEIYAQIKFSIEAHSNLQNEIKVHGIDVKRHLQMYLLHTISRHLTLKLMAPLEVDISEAKLAVWKDALVFILPNEVDQRIGFVSEFQTFLGGVQHALLKCEVDRLSALPISSDLDIAIHKDALSETVQFCKNHGYVKRYKSVKKSFMTNLELFFSDGKYLSIDLIHDFKRKAVRFMDINELLHYSSKNKNGLSVPSLQHDIEYALMFYSLNWSKVPVKYIELFNKSNRFDRIRALRYFQEKYNFEFHSVTELLKSCEQSRNTLKGHIKKQSKWAIVDGVKLKLNYVIDTVRGLIGRRGFMLTFSGVDGVGKTTIIDLVKEQLQSKYRKEVVLMRHRPKVLPILSSLKHGSVKVAENKSTHLSPNNVTKKSVIGSYLRFFYYYVDYLVGQFYVQARYVWRGKIVLYDRYYFDMINHPERTNLVVNQRFAKWMYRSILKPKLNIFLNASPVEILKRKQELDSTQISTLSKKYVQLFAELSRKHKKSRYVVHRNENLSVAVAEILQDIQQIA